MDSVALWGVVGKPKTLRPSTIKATQKQIKKKNPFVFFQRELALEEG